MRKRLSQADEQLQKAKAQEQKLINLKERLQKEHQEKLFKLEQSYAQAQAKLKEALKKAENPDARRLINEAHKIKKEATPKQKEKITELKVGDSVKYRDKRAIVLSLKSKEAMIDIDGMKIRVPRKELRVVEPLKKPKTKKTTISVKVDKPQKASVSIKLLGMRADEAEDEVQNFLSNALLQGFSEVEIIHGTGAGVLSKVVTNLLKKHPKVKEFYRVPGNLGATIVKL
jgi:DNA mismatch repair protein MutS2